MTSRYTESEYSRKLKDPRWQRMRLEILQRDNFTCRQCEATEKTLHVHHSYYERGLDPWDYPEDSLVTLCVDCHEYGHEIYDDINRLLIANICSSGFALASTRDLLQGAFGASGSLMGDAEGRRLARIIDCLLSSLMPDTPRADGGSLFDHVFRECNEWDSSWTEARKQLGQ